jgi:hypothetical protein
VTQILVDAAWAWQDGPCVVGDIAVLKLSSYVDLQQWQVATQVRVGGAAWMLGWGSTEPNASPGTSPDDLQQLETTVIARERCADLLIGVDQVCVDNPNGADGAYKGDSGGPILQQVPGTGTRAVPAGTGWSAVWWAASAPAAATSSCTPTGPSGGPGSARPSPAARFHPPRTGQPTGTSAPSHESASP